MKVVSIAGLSSYHRENEFYGWWPLGDGDREVDYIAETKAPKKRRYKPVHLRNRLREVTVNVPVPKTEHVDLGQHKPKELR